ncbi:hypothetical protein F5Y14DRAFT_420032 [Nemania sp. NC0429]|nr:hypothetical protein F5Y14DRAFT_420032 [Nemania sp. NC0429]
MANRALYFFLAPTWDYPSPPAGPIQLGNVIASVRAPERALYRAPKPDDSSTAAVFSTTQKRVTFSREKLIGGGFGVFTTFLNAVLGLGIDAAVDLEATDTSHFTFESLETTQFLPDPEYIQACVSAEPVRRYLEKSRYRKCVYVITGLKIVRGYATGRSSKGRAVDGTIGAGADASCTGVPVGGGSNVGVNVGIKEHVSWEGASDFVFAFRVRKVVVERKTGAVSREEEYRKGAVLGHVSEGRNGPGLSIVEGAEWTDDDVAGFVKEELIENDELVLCAIPEVQHVPKDNCE